MNVIRLPRYERSGSSKYYDPPFNAGGCASALPGRRANRESFDECFASGWRRLAVVAAGDIRTKRVNEYTCGKKRCGEVVRSDTHRVVWCSHTVTYTRPLAQGEKARVAKRRDRPR